MKHKLLFACLMYFTQSLNLSAQTLPNLKIENGPFQATWESLSTWECPAWFSNAKFGIWAHWGPQCQAEDGDWYGKIMYQEGSDMNKYHKEHFGDPAEFGMKDLCNAWKAEKWDPEYLIRLYKEVGAQFFMTLGQHHDNMDLWDSPYQQWNSVNIGPKRDIVGEWAKVCKKYNLPFGVSIHGSHTWTWYEEAQKYDANLTLEDGYKLNPDGSEKWWKGLDPQELYAQKHEVSKRGKRGGGNQWEWQNGASIPSDAFKIKLQNRFIQLINDYDPQMIYFDDTVLPFWGCDEQIGLNMLAHLYNHSANKNNGKPSVVATGKILNQEQKKALMWDVERGVPDEGQPLPWQTCTCLGQWHYDHKVYDTDSYKSAGTVIRMLVDIVSKNGCLLLSVPLRGNGTIDDKELSILKDIKAWLDVNKESLFDTHPWKVFGESHQGNTGKSINGAGHNEGKEYTSSDIRFTQKNGKVYATVLVWPEENNCVIKSLAPSAASYNGKVKSVKLLGHGKVKFKLTSQGLEIQIPESHPNNIAPVFEITFK